MHLGGQASWVWILHSAIISAMIPHLCLSKMSQRSLLHSSNFFRSELLLPIDFYIWFTALLPAPPFTAASSFSILWSSVAAGSLLCKPSKDMDLFFLKKNWVRSMVVKLVSVVSWQLYCTQTSLTLICPPCPLFLLLSLRCCHFIFVTASAGSPVPRHCSLQHMVLTALRTVLPSAPTACVWYSTKERVYRAD